MADVAVSEPSVEAFAAEARRWLAAQGDDVPSDWGPILPPERAEEGLAWQRRLFEAGFAAIHWPRSAGGRGLSIEHAVAWGVAAAEAGVPPVANMVGLVLAAGAVLGFGTPEQQAQHLPRTARGDVLWCQLFSEPGAGSDLASLSTRAEQDGDGWVVDGHKVWCSGGRASDWGILLARTDPDAARHRGLSCFVVEMRSPGIECRPLRQMTGGAEFDEVFLDGVRLPADALIGSVHGGWTVAMATLTNERGHIGAGTVALERRVGALVAEARCEGPMSAPERDRLVGQVARAKVLLTMGSRQGPQASVASSLMKLAMTELGVETAYARVDRAGMAATLADDAAARAAVHAPGAKMGGGTSEVQRNIIGELLLGLPKEPRPAPGR